MFDTTVTIIGNVLNPPEYKQLRESRAVVTNFKVASTSRRFDKLTNNWVDGASLRVRVNCWKRLAENVSQCVKVGDPVIVTGRLYSRDWIGEDQIRRVSYELEATTVGHDLSRGVDSFTRQRNVLITSATEDDEAEMRVAGELAEPIRPVKARTGGGTFDDDLGSFINSVERDPYDGFGAPEDPFSDQTLGGLGSEEGGFPDEAASAGTGTGTGTDAGVGADEDEAEPASDGESGDEVGGGSDGDDVVEPSRKRRKRTPVGV
jgi:single-strand DNA-binding protein